MLMMVSHVIIWLLWFYGYICDAYKSIIDTIEIVNWYILSIKYIYAVGILKIHAFSICSIDLILRNMNEKKSK